MKKSSKLSKDISSSVQEGENSARVFELAAEIFSLLSTPMRLKILSSLCNGELNVNRLLEQVGTTQSNLSQHLNVLYQSGILARRKEGAQVFYRVHNERAVMLCRSVCTQVAIELDEGNDASVQAPDRLLLPRMGALA